MVKKTYESCGLYFILCVWIANCDFYSHVRQSLICYLLLKFLLQIQIAIFSHCFKSQRLRHNSLHADIFYKNQHNLRNKAFFVKKQNKNQKRLYFFVKKHFAS